MDLLRIDSSGFKNRRHCSRGNWLMAYVSLQSEVRMSDARYNLSCELLCGVRGLGPRSSRGSELVAIPWGILAVLLPVSFSNLYLARDNWRIDITEYASS